MRGEVEIKRGDKVVYKNHNLIVDGAGTLLADVMTANRAWEDIPSASAILDTSNYTIQAISFAKDGAAYGANAHQTDDTKADQFMSKGGTLGSLIVTFKDQADQSTSVSSTYLGASAFPKAPHPSDDELSTSCNYPVGQFVSATNVGLLASYFVPLDSIYPDVCQNVNLLPRHIHRDPTVSATLYGELDFNFPSFGLSYGDIWLNATPGENTFNSMTSFVASHAGCWPDSEANGGTPYYVFSGIEENIFTDINQDFSAGVYNSSGETYGGGFTGGSFDYSGVYNGYFNAVSSMDISGFVDMIMSSVPNAGYQLSSSTSGLTINADPDFAETGTITYQCTMSSGDIGCAQLYGGIYSIGLWTMDIETAIDSGFSPPLQFDVLNNQKRYRLFARKDFNDSLGQIQDYLPNAGTKQSIGVASTNAYDDDLIITWRIHFL